MNTKEELLKEIDSLIELIRSRSNSLFIQVLLPPSLAQKTSDYSSKCIELKKKTLQVADNSVELLDLSKEFLDVEIWTRRRIAKNNLLPRVMGMYLGFLLLFFILIKIDVLKFVNSTLGIQAPEKLVTLGIAGAFVYLATSVLSKLGKNGVGDKQLINIIDISIRLSLAIVVPIILVVLFFKPDGKIGEFAITPELLSFACGYSAKLVVDIFNKLVEKASKMIETI